MKFVKFTASNFNFWLGLLVVDDEGLPISTIQARSLGASKIADAGSTSSFFNLQRHEQKQNELNEDSFFL